MTQSIRSTLLTYMLPVAMTLSLAGCTTAPGTPSPDAGQTLGIEGKVVAVDTDPWAYDGNAVVTVDTAAGRVAVQLPARWNLCKAKPPGDLQAFRPGDRVQAIGTSIAPGQLVVCQQPQHLLRKID